MNATARKVALVTGASRGIGRSIAERLGADGLQLVVNYFSGALAEADDVVRVILKRGGAAVVAEADVSDPTQLRRLFEIAAGEFGGLDVFVGNAANTSHKTSVDTTDDEFDAVYATNARAGFVALRESALRIRDGGRVIMISAGLTRMPRAGIGIYASSKAAVDHLVRVLAHEIGHRGVTVNSVMPGAVLTQALRNAGPAIIAAEVSATPLGRVGEPEDVADVVAFLASDQARWITGQMIGAGGGMF